MMRGRVTVRFLIRFEEKAVEEQNTSEKVKRVTNAQEHYPTCSKGVALKYETNSEITMYF